MLATTQALLGGLRLGGGQIVNIGSISGGRASPFLGPYAASKHAVKAITESMRQELRPWKMHVALIEPCFVATPIWGKGKQAADQLEATLPERGRELYGNAIAAVRRASDRAAARGMPAQRVAKAVAHALTVSHPPHALSPRHRRTRPDRPHGAAPRPRDRRHRPPVEGL